jgi:hypothetical protein
MFEDFVCCRMRAMANPRAQDAPVFETNAMPSNCDPEWEEGAYLTLLKQYIYVEF